MHAAAGRYLGAVVVERQMSARARAPRDHLGEAHDLSASAVTCTSTILDVLEQILMHHFVGSVLLSATRDRCPEVPGLYEQNARRVPN